MELSWSDFFTISLTSRSVFESTAADNAENPNVDHFHHPAVYFNIIVKCGREEKLCQRRYSQFRQLYDDILKNSQSTNNERSYRSSTTQGALQALHFPPKTCFFTKMDEESLDKTRRIIWFSQELAKDSKRIWTPSGSRIFALEWFRNWMNEESITRDKQIHYASSWDETKSSPAMSLVLKMTLTNAGMK